MTRCLNTTPKWQSPLKIVFYNGSKLRNNWTTTFEENPSKTDFNNPIIEWVMSSKINRRQMQLKSNNSTRTYSQLKLLTLILVSTSAQLSHSTKKYLRRQNLRLFTEKIQRNCLLINPSKNFRISMIPTLTISSKIFVARLVQTSYINRTWLKNSKSIF